MLRKSILYTFVRIDRNLGVSSGFVQMSGEVVHKKWVQKGLSLQTELNVKGSLFVDPNRNG